MVEVMQYVVTALLLVLIGADLVLTGDKLADFLKRRGKGETPPDKQPDEETVRRIREEVRKAEQWESLMNYNAQTYRRELEDEDG